MWATRRVNPVLPKSSNPPTSAQLSGKGLLLPSPITDFATCSKRPRPFWNLAPDLPPPASAIDLPAHPLIRESVTRRTGRYPGRAETQVGEGDRCEEIGDGIKKE